MTNSIDVEIVPLTQEQQNMLLSNQDYDCKTVKGNYLRIVPFLFI